MKRTLLAAAFGLLLSAGAPMAADPAVYQETTAEVPADKTGIFAAISGGIAGADADYGADVFGTPLNAGLSGWGGIGGGEVGYQFDAGGFIIGALVSGHFSNLDAQVEVGAPGIDAIVGSEMDYLLTARGKVGFAVGSMTPYLTGGWAWTRWNSGYEITGLGSYSAETDHSGFVVGAGADFDLGGGFYAGVEALYTDQDSQTIYSDATSSVDIDPDLFSVLGKVGYRF